MEIVANPVADTVSDQPGGESLGALLDRSAARLRAAGVAGPRRDARLLLAAALGVDPARVLAHPERRVSAAEAARAEAVIARRARREPVSRILGRREFRGLEFEVTPDTLDPRLDTETVVGAVLDRLPDTDAEIGILDLGTGTGCLLLALLSALPRARGLGVDLSPPALEVARRNAARLGLAGRASFEQRDWAAGLGGPWQAIVSNPPYIVDQEIGSLPPEVARYEPHLALAGGPDGLDAYRSLIPHVGRLLARDGICALEVGAGQAAAVEAIVVQNGLKPIGRAKDLGGIERCLVATLI